MDTQAQETSNTQSRAFGLKPFLVLLLILAAHAILLVFAQRNEWQDTFTRPFMQEDLAYHWYMSNSYAKSIQRGEPSGAYDPRMFGGVQISPVNTPSDRLPVFLLSVTPERTWPAVFNLHYLLMALLIPFLPVLAMRRFQMPSIAMFYTGLLLIAIFWLVMVPFLRTGMVAFAFAVAAGLWLGGETYALTISFSHWRAALIAAMVGVLIFIHPTAVFTAPAFLITVLFWRRKNIDKRIWPWVVVAGIMAIVLNVPWVRDISNFTEDRIPTNTSMTFRSLKHFWDYHVHEKGFQLWRFILPVLIIALTLPAARRDAKWGELAKVAAFWTLLFLAAYIFGSFVPGFNQMQPRRFGAVVALVFPLYVGALFAIASTKEGLFSKFALKPIAFAAAAFLVFALSGWMARKTDLSSTWSKSPLMKMAELINRQCPEDARVLYVQHLDNLGGDELSVLQTYAPREYFGPGGIFLSLCKIGTDGIGYKQSLETGAATIEDWRKYRDLWNIDYVLLPLDNLITYKWVAELEPVGDAGGFRLYKNTAIGNGKFLRGSGKATASLNRIALQNVAPGADNRILLSYHYSRWLKAPAISGLVTRKRIVDGDAYGFLEIDNPPKNFDLVFKVDK